MGSVNLHCVATKDAVNMSQSISDVASILEKELKELGAVINKPIFPPLGYKIGPTDRKMLQLNINEEVGSDFHLGVIKELAFGIFTFDRSVTFYELKIPNKGVEFGALCSRDNILFRYLEANRIATDDLWKRIDVLLYK